MFDLTQLTAAIDPKIGLVVLALWALGFFFKKTPRVPDWLILYLLVLVGIAGSLAILGFTVYAVIQGIIAAALAGLGHQLIKQGTDKRREETGESI